MNKIISALLILLPSVCSADWKLNPYTQRQDYYEGTAAVKASTGAIQAQVDALSISTVSLQSQISAAIVSTGALQAQINAVAVSTGANTVNISALRVSTGAIKAQIDNVAVSTGVLYEGLATEISDRGIADAAIAASTGAISDVVNSLNTWTLSTGTAFGGDVSGTYGAITIGDDTHRHNFTTVDISTVTARIETKVSKAGDTMTGGLIGTTANYSSSVTANGFYSAELNKNAGLLDTPTISSLTATSITVGTSTFAIYTNDNYEGHLYVKSILSPQEVTVVTGNNLVYVDWNGGTPIYAATTDDSGIDWSDCFPVADIRVRSDGTIKYQLSYGDAGNGGTERNIHRVFMLRRFERESGLSLSESTPTRKVAITTGVGWFGNYFNTAAAFDSNIDPMYIYSHNSAGDWIEVASNSYNNTWYDTPTGTATLTANRYAVNWIYRNVSGTQEVDIVLGTGDYTLAQAQGSTPQTPPPGVDKFYYPVGRIIVQKGANTATSVENFVSGDALAYSATGDHNDLIGLQGGAAGEYYHLTSAQNTNIITSTAAIISRIEQVAVYTATGSARAEQIAVYTATNSARIEQVAVYTATNTAAIATKVSKAGDTMTGSLTVPELLTISPAGFSGTKLKMTPSDGLGAEISMSTSATGTSAHAYMLYSPTTGDWYFQNGTNNSPNIALLIKKSGHVTMPSGLTASSVTASGGFLGNLSGNAATATTATTATTAADFTGSLAGDVTGTQGATVVGNDSHTHNFTTVNIATVTARVEQVAAYTSTGSARTEQVAVYTATNSARIEQVAIYTATGSARTEQVAVYTATNSARIEQVSVYTATGSARTEQVAVYTATNAARIDTVGVYTATNSARIELHISSMAPHEATAANTASRIVMRDGSGNFSASKITATDGVLISDVKALTTSTGKWAIGENGGILFVGGTGAYTSINMGVDTNALTLGASGNVAVGDAATGYSLTVNGDAIVTSSLTVEGKANFQTVTSTSVCINNDCKTAWPTSSAGGVTVSTFTIDLHAGGDVFIASATFASNPGMVWVNDNSSITVTGIKCYTIFQSTTAENTSFNIARSTDVGTTATWQYIAAANIQVSTAAKFTDWVVPSVGLAENLPAAFSLHTTNVPTTGTLPSEYGCILRYWRRLD